MWLLVQKQALVSIPLALAIFLAAHNPGAGCCGCRTISRSLMFIVAIAGEALADRQLRRFRRTSSERGGICDAGLWRWSRHPNYFFEWFGWLGYPLIAIDLSGGYPLGMARARSRRPACTGCWSMSPAFRRWNSTCCERAATTFRAYQARTNAFFPWPRARLQEAMHR